VRGQKLTNAIADERLKGTSIKRIGDIIGSGKPLSCQCKLCGYKWAPKATSILNDKTGCPNCRRTKQYLSVEEVDERLSKRLIKRVGKYNGVLNNIDCECGICGHKWQVKAVNVVSGSGCPNCALIKNRKARLSSDDIDRRLIGTKIERIGNYTRMRDPMHCKCKICGYEWYPTPTTIINQGKGCPMCSSMKNERQVATILTKNGIDYKHHKKLNDLIDIDRLLTVDFYLPKFNVIIEYNGHQHYQLVYWPGMNKETAQICFDKQKKRDRLVRKLCKKLGISLISIDGRTYRNNKLEPFMNALIKNIKEKVK
jgi:predicted Zn-ribbon and HTH transcriptional regulator